MSEGNVKTRTLELPAKEILEEERKRAEKYIEEARLKAQRIIEEAKLEARKIESTISLPVDESEIEKEEQAKILEELAEFEDSLKRKLYDFQSTIERNREEIIKLLVKAILGYGGDGE